jgi:hypothetical protein
MEKIAEEDVNTCRKGTWNGLGCRLTPNALLFVTGWSSFLKISETVER